MLGCSFPTHIKAIFDLIGFDFCDNLECVIKLVISSSFNFTGNDIVGS